jgi:Zn-dependent M28 family amino/carboxypeptidase
VSQAEPLENAGRNALEHGAAGLLLLADPEQHPPDSGVAHRQTWVPVPIPTFRIYPSVATKLLLESGKGVTDLALQYTSFPLHTHVRMEVKTVETGLCPAEACQGRNVLGVIPGRDPALADQVLIIGAHYDQLGESPSGLTWIGANDNASGVAVLLQIAQSWHEQGYVPRRTVLFAAWDAFELEQAGSQHYVAHPRYPLDSTVAVIQISAVGAGGDTLSIGGDEESAEWIRSIAEAMGHAAETGNTQTGDHLAFLRALVPACVLSWSSAENPTPYRNLPEDTPETIDLDKLRTSGQIADIAVLGLTEGEPAISDLLAQRAEAILEGDLDAFLATSLPEQEALDKLWFADAQSFSPSAFEMEARQVRILGGTATAVVKTTLTYPREGQNGQTLTKKITQEVRFVHGEDGWQWAGPNLVPAEPDKGFAVMHPPGMIVGLDGLGQLAAEQYAQVATWLGLPATTDATLLLFPGAESLRASTALSMPPDQDQWVGPGRIKLIYSPEISTSLKLSDALIQLLLAEAGVTESAAPWLWQGLPLVIQGKENATRTQLQYLRPLRQELAEGNAPSTKPASWAAVDYLQRQIGGQGIGLLITDLGQACQEGLCENHEGADLALLDAINMDTTTFAAAWQADWQERLAEAQANLDAVLAARQEAALAGDEVAFLNTVEPGVSHLVTEEQHWLADLVGRSVENLALTGEPLALLEDGSILADVTLQYALGDSADRWSEGQVPLTILFTPGSDGYRWAGPLFAVTQGDQISVHYPEGQDELAQAILDEAETIYTQLAAELGVAEPETLAIKLYDNQNAFRTSIFLSFPLTNWVPGWTGAEESVKLRLDTGAPTEAYRPALAVQLARRLLYQMGVEVEWLVHGAGIYLSRDHDGGRAEQRAASSLNVLAREIGKGNLADLSSMPPLYQLSEEDFALASAQAWDVVRYLVTTHGREALTSLLQSLEQGTDLEIALRRVTGQSLPQFESAWAESAVQAHTAPGWIDTALAFDPESAYRHVAYLASPELAGRQAGSPGAETAAAYIAELFASYGLIPAGESDTYFQSFPVSYTTYLDLPQLEILDQSGQVLATMPFRDEFLPLFNEASNKADVEAELVWVPDTYQGLDLSGKVVLCRPPDSISENISQAIEHGASGVIVIGDSENRKEYLSKQPIPIRYPADDAVPVLELTQNGHEHLLEATGLTPPILLNSPPALPLGLRARIKLPISTPTSVQTANVLGLLPGADPVLGQEIIILSAHYDHVGDDPGGRRYSGANDDASGIAVLLEIARLWHERGYHPQRSVLVVAWGAQELGMIGSRYYIEHALFPLDKTVAVLQLDAVGGGGGHYMEAQGFREQEGLLLFSMQVAEDLVDGRLKLAAQAALDQPVEAEPGRVLYASPWEGLSSMLLNTQPSDQAVFHQLGISAVLVTWRGANEDNWPDEIADEVEPYRLGVTGRMVTLVLMTVAGE